jgi:hypothetical protein
LDLRFFTAIVRNVADFSDLGLYVKRRFGGTCQLKLTGSKISRAENQCVAGGRGRFISELIFDPEDVGEELTRSSETSMHIRTTRRYVPGDGNIYMSSFLVEYAQKLLSCVLKPEH